MKRAALLGVLMAAACWDFPRDYQRCVDDGRCADAGTDAGLDGGLDAGLDAGRDAGFNTIEVFCGATRTVLCEYAARCGSFESTAGCVDLITRLGASSEFCRPAHLADVDSGHTLYDPVAGRDCYDALVDSGTCALETENLPAACQHVLTGTLDDGASCFDRDECKAALYCDATAGGCNSGRCRPRKTNATPAGSLSECATTCGRLAGTQARGM